MNRFKLAWILLCMGILMAGCADTQKEGTDLQTEIKTEKKQYTEQKNTDDKEESEKMESDTSTKNLIDMQDTEIQNDSIQDLDIGKKRIICWGDSLTYGQGGEGTTYPSVLEEDYQAEVINYGIQGETARQIGIRMGAFPMSVGTFEIPAETVPVEVSLWQWGEDPIMMRLGDCAINPCTIAGVKGTLSYRAEEVKYYFTRQEAGESVPVPEGTEVETFAAMDKKDSDIIVLFAGTNLPPDKDTVGELISLEKQMIEYLGTEQYIILGLTSKTYIPLKEAFGEHFLDIRSYILQHGLEDAGITPTEQDQKDIADGEIPSSIRVDDIHGNAAFYKIIGEQVGKKLEELGYLTEQDKK
ncbi:MAG: hypothetical protein BHW44_11300 [Roseburia sp. 40_7]|nr:MAG: hypothetical protein BHW44_11300 [Roseburia sp. 40_7]